MLVRFRGQFGVGLPCYGIVVDINPTLRAFSPPMVKITNEHGDQILCYPEDLTEVHEIQFLGKSFKMVDET